MPTAVKKVRKTMKVGKAERGSAEFSRAQREVGSGSGGKEDVLLEGNLQYTSKRLFLLISFHPFRGRVHVLFCFPLLASPAEFGTTIDRKESWTR